MGVRIIADNRERSESILETLLSMDSSVEILQLPVGDYVLSDRICVERKRSSDFENSIIDGRLFEQAKRLAEGFERPVMIIEASEQQPRIRRNALLAAVLKLYATYGIQVIFTEGEEDTAFTLHKIAEFEQEENKRQPVIRGQRRKRTDYDIQLSILSSIPGIGEKLASCLLSNFGSVKNVMMADTKELQKVNKIGRKKAEAIYRSLNGAPSSGVSR